MKVCRRLPFVAVLIAAVGVVLLAGAARARQVYEWTDKDGTYHVTDEFSKVPAEYRSQTTVRGAAPLPSSEAELFAGKPELAARPGRKVVVLEAVKSAFELPERFSTDKGTFDKQEQFRLLGHSTGERGQLYYSDESVNLEVIYYPGEKASSRLGAVLTAIRLMGTYLTEHPDEPADRFAAAKAALIIPSGHMAFVTNTRPASSQLPVHVQFVVGPNGTARLRWSGPKSEYDPLTQETLVSWRNTADGGFVLPAATLDDLNNPWVMGGVVAVLVVLASLATGLIIFIKKRGD